MERDLEADLRRWKDQEGRMPLLLRGARQVGKTYLVEKFGKAEFSELITLNFELHPEYKKCFSSLEPEKIINSIELVTGKTIKPGSTLLFFDEIQECPGAIMAMRYFKEQMPLLHLIGAGSLLEFVLNDEDFRMPVGRIQFLYLRPLSFGEYLDVLGHSNLRSYLKTVHVKDTIEEVVHEKLLSLVREYCIFGGMPAVISKYLATKSALQCQELQSDILFSFRKDFGKYGKRFPQEHLETIFSKTPGIIGQWLKYVNLDPDTSSATLKEAVKKLAKAGVILPVYATSGAGLPFISHMNEKKLKLLFLDIGLVKRACNLDVEILMKQDLLLINQGGLAEQFVGQELLAYTGKKEVDTLFAWTRDSKGSQAEVDYLVAMGSYILPIEVKAKTSGALRSLRIFLSEKKSPFGIRISEVPFSFYDKVLSIPFYMIEQIPRLSHELLKLVLK
jgi:predicted AAA+ superfamily ATPase